MDRRIDQRLLPPAADQAGHQAGVRLSLGRAGIGDAAAVALAGQAGIAAAHDILAGGVVDHLRTIATADQARSALAAQIATTVRWDECMENIHARGVDCVLEIGAGPALARMWNQRYPDVPARAADEFRSVQAVVGWVGQRIP